MLAVLEPQEVDTDDNPVRGPPLPTVPANDEL